MAKLESKKLRIAVIIAVHNRWEMTHRVLSQLDTMRDVFDVCIHIFDDGSTDETKFSLNLRKDIEYLRGDGSFFWAKSMKKAENSITEPVDYILWLNNDVSLRPDASKILLKATVTHPQAILVGQFCDSASGEWTYGGLHRLGRHPHRVSKVESSKEYTFVDTFAGNLVLVPESINKELNGIDGEFQHAYADYDFGFRAKKRGYQIVAIPGFIGKCDRNPNPMLKSSRLTSFRILKSRKYLPWKSQMRFCRRHGGIEWPIYFIAPYLRTLIGVNKVNAGRITSEW